MLLYACAGFADYGVKVNPSKTRLSFDMITSSGANLQVTGAWNAGMQPVCALVLAGLLQMSHAPLHVKDLCIDQAAFNSTV